MSDSFVVDFSGVKEGFGHVPPGTYIAKVVNVTKGSKNFDFLEWTFETQEGYKIKEITTLKPDGLFNLYNLMGALMKKPIPKVKLKITPEIVLGKVCVITVADQSPPNEKYSEITAFAPISSAPIPEATLGTEPVDDGTTQLL